MRTSDVDILIVPDLGDAAPDHWQSRWVRNLKTARRVEQADWRTPRGQDWADTLFAAVVPLRRPAVVVAHGLGVLAVAHAAERLAATTVVGAFLVAPLDLSSRAASGDDVAPATGSFVGGLDGFWPLPTGQLPWPTLVIASANDPMCAGARAEDMAKGWGADFTDAGNVGHLDTASGHGPWPEGLLRFGQFLRQLG